MDSTRALRGYATDVLLAVVIGGLLVLHVRLGSAPGQPHTPLDYALLVAGALALAWCRRAPVAALLATTGFMVAYTLRVEPGPPASFPVLIAVFMAARAGKLLAPVASLAYLAAFLATDLTGAAADPTRPPTERTVLLLGWFLAANVAGAVARRHRAYLEQVERRAAEAERTREETALRRAGEERLRIARELHDSLTHSISIIKLQANVAIHLARKHGEAVPEALLAIQEASGEAMRELRATLEVLRHSDETDTGDGLERLTGLVRRTRAAGLAATLTVTGPVRDLPPEVARAAYRTVQEALTNVSRHAPGATATVRVEYLPSELSVRVDNDGAPVDAPAYGNGLTGMRERAAALGGSLHAAPAGGGGFTVHATLPLSADPVAHPEPAAAVASP